MISNCDSQLLSWPSRSMLVWQGCPRNIALARPFLHIQQVCGASKPQRALGDISFRDWTPNVSQNLVAQLIPKGRPKCFNLFLIFLLAGRLGSRLCWGAGPTKARKELVLVLRWCRLLCLHGEHNSWRLFEHLSVDRQALVYEHCICASSGFQGCLICFPASIALLQAAMPNP